MGIFANHAACWKCEIIARKGVVIKTINTESKRKNALKIIITAQRKKEETIFLVTSKRLALAVVKRQMSALFFTTFIRMIKHSVLVMATSGNIANKKWNPKYPSVYAYARIATANFITNIFTS